MEQSRPRIAVAVTNSYLGAAVCDSLVDRFDIVALTRSIDRSGISVRGRRIQWRLCDHFPWSDVASSLQDVDYMVYLVHNRDPSAQLDQANTRDMDLLVADNFARAASLAGVKQIVYRTRLISNSSLGPDAAEVESEMYRVLASHGVPVTALRTCLIVGSGGELIRLLIRIVKRLPLIPVPQLAQTMRRPISQADLMTAFRYCVGNPETFGKQYDVFGPEPVSLQRMLEETASVLGCERTFFPAPFLSERFLSLLLRMVYPSIHPDLLTYIIETFRSDTNGSENPVERANRPGCNDVPPHAGDLHSRRTKKENRERAGPAAPAER